MYELQNCFELVLGQGLEGEEIQCPGRWFMNDFFEDRQVIYKAFAACSWGCNDYVFSISYGDCSCDSDRLPLTATDTRLWCSVLSKGGLSQSP